MLARDESNNKHEGVRKYLDQKIQVREINKIKV